MNAFIQLIHKRVFRLRLVVIIMALALMFAKLHDPLIPVFIVISQIALLIYDYRKLRMQANDE
jgi:hypothetical protein